MGFITVVPRRGPHLRTIVSVATIAITVIALFVATALVLLTTWMREVTVERTKDMENIRIVAEAEVALLLFAQTTEPSARARLADEARDYLANAAQYVGSEDEAAILAYARRAVDTLVTMNARDPQFSFEQQRAFMLLHRLSQVNVAQAHELEERAMAWDRLATVLGFTGGGAVVIIAVVGIWWLRRRAFRPVFELAAAMEQFGRGDRAARAPDASGGPAELHDMVLRFNAMADALASQQDAHAAFLAAVAHDLKTPLGVLLAQVQIMSPERPLPPEPQVRRSLALMRRQLVRLDRMLKDLVTFTGMDAGAFRLEMEDHDLVDLIRGAVDLFEGLSSRHWFELQVPDAPVIVHLDKVRIEQVITNLLSNAIKYSPGGGPVTVQLTCEDGAAVVTVTDAGVGIAPDDQQRLFEPFTRLQNVGSAPGSGLGLYVVRRIVDAHGGIIEVDSEPRHGTCFRVRLPLIAAEDKLPLYSSPPSESEALSS